MKLNIRNLSPEALALAVTLGLVCGVFPVYGFPTILCGVAAFLLRANVPAVQVVNQVTLPLQVALWLPLSRLGGLLFGSHTAPAAPVWAALHAIGAWCCVSAPLGIGLYWALLWACRRISSINAGTS